VRLLSGEQLHVWPESAGNLVVSEFAEIPIAAGQADVARVPLTEANATTLASVWCALLRTWRARR
jgi:hypothetical protein